MVISDATGMTPNLRNQVDWLASIGYLAAAPDLVRRAVRQRCLFSTMRQALRGEGAVFEDFETVRGWLADHEASTGRVAVAGFCFDGGFSLMFAGSRGFDDADSDYGGFTSGALASLATKCPVVGRHKGNVKKDPAEIAEVLWSHSIPHELKAYPAAGHSFMNDGLDVDSSQWVLILGDMSTSDYATPTAQGTRSRIKSFFDAQMAH
jgi:carboxymethylenebutenolidase